MEPALLGLAALLLEIAKGQHQVLNEELEPAMDFGHGDHSSSLLLEEGESNRMINRIFTEAQEEFDPLVNEDGQRVNQEMLS